MKVQKKLQCEYSLLARSGLLIIVIWLALSMGCVHSSDKEVQLKKTGKSNLHQVQSAALREKMRSMNALMYEYALDELRYDEQRSRQAASIAKIAGSMSDPSEIP